MNERWQKTPHDIMAIAEAKLKGDKLYTSDRPCKNGHTRRRVSNSRCDKCRTESVNRAMAKYKATLKRKTNATFLGKLCKRGHDDGGGSMRYVKGHKCVSCKQLNTESRRDREDKRKPSKMAWNPSWGMFEDHPHPFIRGERYIVNLRKSPFVRAA